MKELAKPVIYVKRGDKPKKVLVEMGKKAKDYWYYWRKHRLHKILKRLGAPENEYEPVRVAKSGEWVLTRMGWQHRIWKNLTLIDSRIQVAFVGPGRTPILNCGGYHGLIFRNSIKICKLEEVKNYDVKEDSPPNYFKESGWKPHYPLPVHYEGWPPLERATTRSKLLDSIFKTVFPTCQIDH